MTAHQWPNSVVSQGYKLQCTSPPQPWFSTSSTSQSTEVDQAVNTFLSNGVIELSPTQDSRFLSHFFTIQEPGKIRPILDCKRLNKYIQCQHFKMEGVPALRELIQPGDFMCKIDLKDAYTVVPIHPEYRHFISFRHRNKIYQYKTLPFGLSVAPRVFSKLMRYAMEPLRKEGFRLTYYLDDICVLAKSKQEMATLTSRLLSHLINLGFIINWKKSVTTPLTTQEFLGFHFNTMSMRIKVPPQKFKKLLGRIKQTSSIQSCRWIAALLGKITAMLPAVGDALLHIRYLQRDLSKALHMNNNQWDRPCPLSPLAHSDILWWTTTATAFNGLPIMQPPRPRPFATLHVDASDSGWGVASPIMQTSGFWNHEDRLDSINVRELKTILYALKLHKNDYANKTIEIFTDNITALKYVTKQGGTSSPILQALALEIQELLLKFNITIQCAHIAGIKNVVADRLSRIKKPAHEWSLPKTWFKWICTQFKIRPVVDAFASKSNTCLPTYWSYQPDPGAAAVDAFQQQWPAKGLFLHPPWKLIPQVLMKMKKDRVKTALMITPMWPTQHWWPMVMAHSRTPPLRLELSRQKILCAWLLSGNTTRTKG
jgi:hypothetical protein